MKLKRGDKIKVFSDTDTDAYINYFDSIGLTSKLENGFIVITGYNFRKYQGRGKDSQLLQDIGKRIRDIRKKMYFTVDEIAEEIGTRPMTVYAWESGRRKPKGEAFQKFLEFSGATKEYVLDGKGEWIDDIPQLMKEVHKEIE